METPPMVRIGHRLLPFDGQHVGEMRSTELGNLLADPCSVRRMLEEDGYVYFKGVLDRRDVLVPKKAPVSPRQPSLISTERLA